jgi:hypothetical protein
MSSEGGGVGGLETFGIFNNSPAARVSSSLASGMRYAFTSLYSTTCVTERVGVASKTML